MDSMIKLRGRVVAVVGATRCWIVDDDLDPASGLFVLVMCLCKREVDEGRICGPFISELAERWARLILIGPHNLTGDPNAMASWPSGSAYLLTRSR